MFYSQAHFVNVYCYIRPALVKMDIPSSPSHFLSLCSYFYLHILTATYWHLQLSARKEKKKKARRKLYAKGKVYFLLNLFLKFNYVALIHNKLMATYGAHIRCSHVVSAEQKFPWKNTTSFTGELLCSALTVFHQPLLRPAMRRPWTGRHASDIVAPWWAARDTTCRYRGPGRSPSLLVSLSAWWEQMFQGQLLFKNSLFSISRTSSVLQGFRTLKHWSGSHRDQTSLFGSAAQPPCFSGSLGRQADPAQLQGTEEDPLCYRVQSSTLETPWDHSCIGLSRRKEAKKIWNNAGRSRACRLGDRPELASFPPEANAKMRDGGVRTECPGGKG